MNLDVSQILTQIIAFLVMFWVLKRYGWKPLQSLLEERHLRIKAEFESIAAQKAEVKELLDAYREKLEEIEAQSAHIFQESMMQAKQRASELHNSAHAEAKAILSKAKLDIQQEIVNARSGLKVELVDLVIATTEKILQIKLDKQKQEALIADFIEEANLK